MATLTRDVADRWITRWDRQQEGFLPDREERFTALIDAVAAGAGRPDPLVLDLGCGPGSLSARLLDRLPQARVIAIDTDPLLLSLGRALHAGRDSLTFADLDLRAPGWAARLRLDRKVDAAVSTTALHWISEAELRVTYGELATVMRPGGLFLNGDNFSAEDATPVIARLDRALQELETERRFAGDRPEGWRQWWDAAAADPVLGGLKEARDASAAGHHGSESGLLSTHVRVLRETGFGEVGPLWQHGDNRILCAVR
ncbi:class I SAM-dependent methyltransferase [Actinoallomurus sp. NPDC050550]|uniref:class I SAM-dependent methyltransferase n=1 Tax=Actinoallomurus sp. NPDC050550 TaxID=3154937 RepID=UPI0033EB30B8